MPADRTRRGALRPTDDHEEGQGGRDQAEGAGGMIGRQVFAAAGGDEWALPTGRRRRAPCRFRAGCW